MDGLRHRDMCVDSENQRKLETARPAILAIAYATASSWKSTIVAPGSVATDFNAVYLCTDDVLQSSRVASELGKDRNHRSLHCSANSETPTVAREDTRKWLCSPLHKVTKKKTPYRVASQATFMITSAPSAPESLSCILFTDTEAILDNAAGQSVFKNPALLHAIVGTPSVSSGGVNSQSPRLEISAKGKFGDLGSVGVSRNATVLGTSYARWRECKLRIKD